MVALVDAIDALIDCVCDTLETAGRPACACYPTIGEPIYRPCCNCGPDGFSGEVTASLENMYPVDGNSLLATNRLESCRRGPWGADVTVRLTRCYPTIQEDGNAPEPADIAEAARNLSIDAVLLRRALTCCADQRLAWRSLGVETDPEGGCSMITARVTIGVE